MKMKGLFVEFLAVFCMAKAINKEYLSSLPTKAF